jgi:HAD superfamily hydrolase (TIGR01549 family)
MAPVSAISLVIFDLDDTLLDTGSAIRQARRDVVKSLFPTWPEPMLRQASSVWRATTLLYRDDFTAVLGVVARLADSRLPVRLKIAAVETSYRERVAQLVRPRTRIVAAARRLASDGHRIAIVSNGDEPTQRSKIDQARLGDLAPNEYTVVCDGRRMPYKPDPAGILAALAVAGADRAVLVGDRLTDVLAGRLAGISTVRVRARCADVERGSALRRLVTPDRFVAAGGCYTAVNELLTTADVRSEW